MFLKFSSLSRKIHSQNAPRIIVAEQLKRYFLRLESHSRALDFIKTTAGLNHRHRRRRRHHHHHHHHHRHQSPKQLVLILLVQTRNQKIQAQVLQKALRARTKTTRWKLELWLRSR